MKRNKDIVENLSECNIACCIDHRPSSFSSRTNIWCTGKNPARYRQFTDNLHFSFSCTVHGLYIISWYAPLFKVIQKQSWMVITLRLRQIKNATNIWFSWNLKADFVSYGVYEDVSIFWPDSIWTCKILQPCTLRPMTHFSYHTLLFLEPSYDIYCQQLSIAGLATRGLDS